MSPPLTSTSISMGEEEALDTGVLGLDAELKSVIADDEDDDEEDKDEEDTDKDDEGDAGWK